MAISVTLTTDQTAAMLANIQDLTRHELLVGIPADKMQRQDSRQPTNSQLAYWHENGVPSRNLPARPFMAPGVRKVQPQITRVLEEGARSVLRGQSNGALQALHKAGMLARNSIVNEITDPSPPFAPLAPRTIRGRLMRTQAGQRKLKKMLAMGRQMGVSSDKVLTGYQQGNWETGGAGLNMRPLVDTGQIRASITYVVRERPGAAGGGPGAQPGWIRRTLTTIGGWFKKGT
jgi:hypothetical protein